MLLFALPMAAVLFGCATAGTGTVSDSAGVKDNSEKIKEAASKVESAVNDASVEGDWELRFIAKDKERQDVTFATMSVVKEGGNRYALTGFSGVNTFNTALTIGDEGAITVDKKVMTTRVGGSEDMMKAESAFLDALKASSSWKVLKVGNETLEMKGDVTLIFSRLKITDRIWNLTSQSDEGGRAVISIPEGGRKITLMIDAKGASHIFTGLNITDAETAIDERLHTISFSTANSAITLASGSEEEMERERLYLKNLDIASSYFVSGKTLTLLDKSGKTVAVFSAQDLL